MKAVSDAYKLSMKSMLRGRSYIRVAFYNVDTTAAGDGEWVSNGAQGYSELETLDSNHDYGNTYATMELNRWGLDGKTDILPATGMPQDGFISSVMSGEDGLCTSPVKITRQFSDAHTLTGLTVIFDTRCSEWANSVTITLSLSGTVVDTWTESPTSAELSIASDVIADKIEISIDGLLPHRRPRIESILYGIRRVFENDEIISTEQKHDVDPLCRRLPQETMQFTVLDYEHNYDPDNPSGIYAYIDVKSPVTIQHGYDLPSGEREWLKPDRYVMTAKPSIRNNQATFAGTGLIGSLSGTFYKSALGLKNFYDMAVEVLEDANLRQVVLGEDPWVVDTSLQTMFTTAVLPIDTHMNCLQFIAHACCCRLYTDDDNVIHIEPFRVTKQGIYRGTMWDNGHVWYSKWDTVSKGNNATTTYATLELNRWSLDGENQIIIPDEDPDGKGFASAEMAGNTGDFSIAPVFGKTFDDPHDMQTLSLRFDTPLVEYPTTLQVRYYNGETLLDTQTVHPTSTEICVRSQAAVNCTRYEVAVLSGLPQYRVRVSKIWYRDADFTLDFSSIQENSQTISKIDQLKAVTITKYNYTVSDGAETLFEGTTTDTSLHVEFAGLAQDVQISVSGGALVSSTVYGRAADLVLSSGTKTVMITGKTLSENSVVVSYPVSSDGEIDKEENTLITNDAMRDALADHVKAYLQMRNTYEASYRGDPAMEVGDIIGLQTQYTDDMDALILVDEIRFNGSLSGKMKVKGLI